MRTLTGLIPFVALALLSHKFYRGWGCWRASILSAAMVTGVALTVLTEGLSLFRLLSFRWVLGAWLAFVAILAMSRLPGRWVACDPPPEDPSVGRWWFALAGLAVIVLAIGVIAVVAPPNTVDSLVYHMPRVSHWIQNGSVAHYPTHVLRQLHLAPWAEFAILQPQILTGSDRLANLVQWLAMIGSLLGVSLIAQQLGGNARCQILAAVVCATIPMGLLQASGTQNDYVVSFWLVCFVYSGRVFSRQEGRVGDATGAWWAGASLGLAVLTKATAYIFALPFLMWMILDRGWRRGKPQWRTLAIIALAVVVLNAGHSWRNIRIYGSPLGPGREGPLVYANEAFGPSAFVSNAVRNVALHLGTPNERVNALLERGIGWLHGQLGADINDAKTTWLYTTFHVVRPTTHEDLAGNVVHLVLIALSGTMLVMARTLRRRLDLLAYAGALVVAFLLFVLYLKWQPWHSRLHLPLFVLWSPLIALIWEQYRRPASILASVLLVMSVPWVVYSHSRPLLGPDTVISRSRVDQYFVNLMGLREPYVAGVRTLQAVGCSKIGLWPTYNPEYPVWVLLGQEGGGTRARIEHIGVTNESARSFPQTGASFDPCAILLITDHPSLPAALPFNGSVYRLQLRAPPVSLFVRE